MNCEHATLSIQRGDSLTTVQRALALTVLPTPIPECDGEGYFYHLPELGFWVFFDKAYHVYSIRFNSPYAYAIEGIKIGDTKEDVVNMRGKPDRHFPVPVIQAWIYDKPTFLRIDFNRETNRVEKILR